VLEEVKMHQINEGVIFQQSNQSGHRQLVLKSEVVFSVLLLRRVAGNALLMISMLDQQGQIQISEPHNGVANQQQQRSNSPLCGTTVTIVIYSQQSNEKSVKIRSFDGKLKNETKIGRKKKRKVN